MKTYLYKDVLEKTTQYFNGDDLAAKVFIDKYALKNNSGELLEDSPEIMHRRISKEFARIEKNKFKNPLSEDEIFALLDKFKYIVPQGSPMFGIGNNYQTISLSNCFVAETPVDSYGGILKTDQQLVQISKRRGGVGVDISNLRPNGTITKNAAKSSTGTSSFLERYSNSIREVGQSGRRGALMVTISVHHPDILEFVTIKNDDKKVTGANISVRLSNEFLMAVKNDTDYELRFPVDSDSPTVSRMVSAKMVWNTIIHSAWLRAEPGLLFWDNITQYNAVDCYADFGFKTVSTNPCQPGWATLLTPNGISTMGDIKIGDLIWSESGWTKVIDKAMTGIKKVNKYTTSAGCFYGTENHKVVSSSVKVEAGEATAIDRLSGQYDSDIILDPQVIMDGIVFGDGSVHKASNNLVYLYIGDKDKDYFNSEISHLITRHRPGLKETAYEIQTNISASEIPYTYLRDIPDRYFYGDKNVVASFLRGLFTANGSFNTYGRATLKTSSRKVIERAQVMLSSIGINSYITNSRGQSIAFSNGTYTCRDSYELNITSDAEKFIKSVGFVQQYKMERAISYLQNHIRNKGKSTYDITSIDFISEEPVYDITVDNEPHTYWTGGLNVSNCAEIGLCHLDSCRLMVLNFYSYVNKPFLTDASFDFDLFYKHGKIAQRLLDDLIDLEIEKVDKIIEKISLDPEDEEVKKEELNIWLKVKDICLKGRRTGLGGTGLGDMLAALGIKYGSQESVDFIEKVQRHFKMASYESSNDMAQEIGTFPIWDWSIEKDSQFLLKICEENPELYKKIAQHGRRNIANLTFAPTGTVSLMTQTSSGCEPVFQLSYTRRKKINPNDSGVRVDFVDQNGDSWQEFIVYHPKVQEWMKVTGQSDIEKSPWFGCCAEEINWTNRVNMQAAMQRHIDHSISSTINLPENVTEDAVAKIYETAWESGCKGITVYRKNCRSGVLVDTKTKENVKTTTRSGFVKRSKELTCDVYHCKVKGEEYFCIISLDGSGNPYEVFAGKNGVIPYSIESGVVYKQKRGHYQLKDTEGNVILENITKYLTDDGEALTRMVSMSLRSSCESNLKYIVDQLMKVQGDFTNLSKAISRCLKKYIKDGESTSEKCPECGVGTLVYESGCKACKECGWSGCS
jgi:ribonucleotide reductase alpha subunit